jgi:hypothetical protein
MCLACDCEKRSYYTAVVSNVISFGTMSSEGLKDKILLHSIFKEERREQNKGTKGIKNEREIKNG